MFSPLFRLPNAIRIPVRGVSSRGEYISVYGSRLVSAVYGSYLCSWLGAEADWTSYDVEQNLKAADGVQLNPNLRNVEGKSLQNLELGTGAKTEATAKNTSFRALGM